MERYSDKKKPSAFAVFVIILILVVFIGSSCTYTTYQDQYSVVKQFGRIVKTNDTAGLRFKVPFIQDVTTIPKKTRLYDLNKSEVITSDKKTMICDAFVLWSVTDAKMFTQTLNASESTAQSRLDVIVYNAIKTTISSMTQDEVIASRSTSAEINAVDTNLEDVELNDYTDKDESVSVNAIAISDRLLLAIGNQCDQYGIKVTDIEIKALDLPEENKNAVYDRMISERNNIATAYKAQGQSEAQKIRNVTDKEVAVILSKANAEAEKTVAEGEAEYMRILAEAYNDPAKADYYLFMQELETVKSSFNNENTTLIIDKNSPFAEIFNGVR